MQHVVHHSLVVNGSQGQEAGDLLSLGGNMQLPYHVGNVIGYGVGVGVGGGDHCRPKTGGVRYV